MTTHIALLRAVNVGGHQPVAMSDLCAMLAKLGFSDSRSLLQSGNLIFRCEARTGAVLEALLEREAEKHLKLKTDFFVRSAQEWKEIVAHNPFREQAASDPAHLLVMFAKSAPSAKAVAALQAVITGPEIVRARGRQVYIVYPDGIGRSRLTNAMLEKKLGTRGTARNWNTILKLGALAR
ncbi:MAG TPA: DUF1697 domain-containing protein [Candidatus Binataceae bacterium]|nr:DUF1697 domain-containing protein [Candidatus Binataceae bacterium]